MKLYKSLLFAACMMLGMTQSFAWGQLGHYIIGYLAEIQMKNSVRKKVEKILYPMSIARSGTWMDEIRSDDAYDYATTWHYMTSVAGEYDSTIQEPTGDAFEALQRLKAELIAGGLSPKEESEKLKMLIHIVEDIHQPLHVGTGEDRGGNDVKIDFFGRPSNLHAVWDTGMIERQNMSYKEIGQELCRRITPRLQQHYLEVPIQEWLTEAVEYRPSIYQLPKDTGLGYEYMYQNYYIVEERLLAASVRLAHILGEIYG